MKNKIQIRSKSPDSSNDEWKVSFEIYNGLGFVNNVTVKELRRVLELLPDETFIEGFSAHQSYNASTHEVCLNLHNIKPTPPTQEKEVSLDPRKIPVAENVDYVEGQGWKSTCPKKGRTHFGCGICDKHTFASKTKPTQDTESWEEDMFSFTEDLEQAERLIEYIKQKKQEWEDEADYKAWKEKNESLWKQARTQGAEAAVEYIKKTTGIEDDFSIHSDYIIPYSVLEEARRV